MLRTLLYKSKEGKIRDQGGFVPWDPPMQYCIPLPVLPEPTRSWTTFKFSHLHVHQYNFWSQPLLGKYWVKNFYPLNMWRKLVVRMAIISTPSRWLFTGLQTACSLNKWPSSHTDYELGLELTNHNLMWWLL